jgi:hypothetical protein
MVSNHHFPDLTNSQITTTNQFTIFSIKPVFTPSRGLQIISPLPPPNQFDPQSITDRNWKKKKGEKKQRRGRER